ncbi:DNA-binding response regulator [Bacillus sp. AFS054943]|uniref:DNA-binding response regulator n=2 Tax=Bacillaceae TaxID=186817 RepID=A0A2C1LXE6_BACCE|nr:DNA-binding response regulator [Bacillus cereus]PFA61909.1 DNA-binding response regulator [Bacillus sp. AFS015896]PGL82319.1 DNA-binding response regulator [Bacillus sp. AFS054943]PGX02467.1 DNA-binding response regulator [Bacillus sp. AFS033286]PGZ69859.1 DNA-binding response regulator [Bacillus sp. AFS029637]
MNYSLLLVDDEKGLLDVLELALRKDGFQNIHTATTGVKALNKIKEHSFDLIILDIMLPDIDGLEVCRQMRTLINAPIIFLTAKGTDMDKIMGLTIGGDDYITKPFNSLEVIARVKANLRRQEFIANKPKNSEEKRFNLNNNVQVLEESGQILVGKTHIECPAKEFELLIFLCNHPNRIFSVRQLYQQVWGDFYIGDEKTVVIHISRLRKKIEADPKKPSILVNVRGLGYKLILKNEEQQN